MKLLPTAVQEAFAKFMVEKACMQYLRQDDRFHTWSDEMLRQYVHRFLKMANAGETLPGAVVLFCYLREVRSFFWLFAVNSKGS